MSNIQWKKIRSLKPQGKKPRDEFEVMSLLLYFTAASRWWVGLGLLQMSLSDAVSHRNWLTNQGIPAQTDSFDARQTSDDFQRNLAAAHALFYNMLRVFPVFGPGDAPWFYPIMEPVNSSFWRCLFNDEVMRNS